MEGRACFDIFLLLLLITWIIPSVSQNVTGPPGLSIDCGSDANYTDDKGIHWVTDAGYIATGKTLRNLDIISANKTNVNVNQSKSLRYFDEGRSRDCYVLPVISQTTYLIRPTFYLGYWNALAANVTLTSFDVYLDTNVWLEIALDQDYPSYKNYTRTYEALVYIQTNDDQLDFCLVRNAGIPFISSLELRQLAPGMYTEVTGNYQFMSILDRVNPGADLNGPAYLRYPDDYYDRLWHTPGTFDNASHIKTTHNLSTSPNFTPERPPQKVMEDAWVYYNYSYLTYFVKYFTGSPVGPVAVYSYFQEVDGNASASNLRSMNYFVNGIRIDSFTIDLVDPYEVGGCVFTIYDTTITINITNMSDNISELPPVLNAFEIYGVIPWNETATATEDVMSIQGIQNEVNLTDWTGDPCVPVPYDWLKCSIPDNQAAYNQLVAPDSIAYVTGMSLADIVTIQSVPEEIANLSQLTSLNLSNTSLASIPSTGFSFPQNLTVLDLSSNRFSGVQALKFLQSINVKSLQKLYATNNALEGQFPLEQLYAEFPNLEEASFDANPNINGILNLTSWHKLLISSVLNATVKVTAIPTLTGAVSPAPVSTSLAIPVVSLTNNGITGITPSLDVLSSDIDTYLGSFQNQEPYSFNNHGFLLGGNPWCQQQQAFSALPLSQQYLCRSSTNEVLPGLGTLTKPKGTNNVGAIVGGVLGGFAFLVACVLLAAALKFWKQTSSLKDVQEELARQSVKPPFYSYSDLRTATNDFSPENKLGQGTFGDVHKGLLSHGKDGTPELMAVKRLYPSSQALPEFLNEVVLITGIKHRNLVQLKGCCIYKQDKRMLVYEYAENGNLAEALWGERSSENPSEQSMRTTLDWNQRLETCVGIARGLSYLHEELQPRLIHRDIKPYNILLDKNFQAKIADFGLARSIMEGESEVDFTKVAGTNGYFAPEYATQGQLTEKADVFSFGVVLLEIVSGRKCIDPQLSSEKQYLQSWARHLKNEKKLLDLLDPAVRKTADNSEVLRVINLAFLCLDFYPERRPTMSQAVAMLQGIIDVTLYRSSEPDTESHAFRAGFPYNYMKLPLISLNSASEEHPSDSFEMNASSSSHTLEMSKFSGR